MKKKLFSMILVVSMILSFSTLSFAQGDIQKSNGRISRDTVVTADNLNEVLKMFGIDPSTGKESNTPISKAAVTVGQIEDALNLIEKEKNNLKIDETINNSYTVTSNSTDMISPMAALVYGTVTLSSTSQVASTFSLKHTVTAGYERDLFSSYKSWRSTSSPYVLVIDQSAPGSKRQLDKVNYITSSFNSGTVTVNSSVEVGWYLVIGIPGTPFTKDFYQGYNTVTSTVNWGSSYIPEV